MGGIVAVEAGIVAVGAGIAAVEAGIVAVGAFPLLEFDNMDRHYIEQIFAGHISYMFSWALLLLFS